MENKKAQGLSINTIILIILGVVVLVALIFGFTKGWEGIKQWIAPSNNIAEVKSQCDVACTTENKYNYCYQKRDVKVDSTNIKGTSCYVLANKKTEYGINTCAALNGQCDIKDSLRTAQDTCVPLEPPGQTPLPEETELWYIGDNHDLIKKACKDLGAK